MQISKQSQISVQIKIPLFANGDVTSAADATRIINETGANGVMIGRGAIGNPFVFSEIIAALSDTPYAPPTLDKIKETALLHLNYAISDKGESVAVLEARGQLSKYFHSFRGCAELRARINKATTYSAVKDAIDSL